MGVSTYNPVTGQLTAGQSYVNGVSAGSVTQWFDGTTGAFEGYEVSGAGMGIDVSNVRLRMAFGSRLTLGGTGDEIEGGGGPANGTQYIGTVTFLSSHATITNFESDLILAGTGDFVKSSGSVTLDAGVGATIDGGEVHAGAGNAVKCAGSCVVYATGDLAGGLTSDREATGITFGPDAVAGVVIGRGDSITTAGLATLEASDDVIALGAGATKQSNGTTIKGSGNTIHAADGEAIVLAGDDGANPDATSKRDSITGNDLTITDVVGDALAIQGGSDTVSIDGSVVTLASDSSITVTGRGGTVNVASGDKVALAKNVTATIAGNGGALTATGSDVVTVSGAKVALTGDGTIVTGNNDVITATGVTVNHISGVDDVLTGGGATINGQGDGNFTTALTLEGSGYVIGAINGEFTLSSGSSATITGNDDFVTAAAGTSLTVDAPTAGVSPFGGNGDSIYTSGGVSITLNAGASASVYGGGNTIFAAKGCGLYATDDTVMLNGSYTTVSGNGNTLEAADGLALVVTNSTADLIKGNQESVFCSNSSVTLSGTGDAVSASHSTITLQGGGSASFSRGNDTINAGSGNAVTINSTQAFGADIVNAIDDAAGITLGAGAQVSVIGGGDTITALGSNVITASNDTLFVSSGGDSVIGNNDTIIVGDGASNLHINATGDTLKLSDSNISRASLVVSSGGSGSDLVLSNAAAGDRITWTWMLSLAGAGVKKIQLADGTSLSAQQLVDMETTGTVGNDTLYGWAEGGNVFDGKGGNDLTIGHGGGDKFVFNAGYGQLEVKEFDNRANPDNLLQLGVGIKESSIALSTSNGTDLLITDGVTGDKIRLDGMLTSGSAGIQEVKFADGTEWTRSQLLALPVDSSANASARTIADRSSREIVSGGIDTLASHDVNALISAMASFNAPAAGATATPDSYQSPLQSMIAANWH